MFKKLNIDKETLKKFIIVCITSEFIYFVYAAKNVLYTPYLNLLGLTDSQLGMALTVQGWVAFFGGIPSSWVLNRFSARNLQAINLALSGLTCFYMISGKVTYTGFLIVCIIWGFTLEAFYWGAVTKSVRCMFPDDKQGIAFGSMEMTRGLTGVVEDAIAVAIFAAIGNELLGMKVVMGICGVLLIIFGFLVYKLLPEENYLKSETNEGKNKESFKAILKCLKVPQLWLCGFMGMGVYAVYMGCSYFQPFLEDVFGVPTILVAIFAMVGSAWVRMIAGPISGFVANNKFKGSAPWMRILFAVGIIILVAIIAMPKSQSLVWPVTIVLIILQIVVFMLRGVYYAPIGESGIPREVSGSAMAIAILLIQSPMCWASAVYGKLIESGTVQGYKTMFTVMAALYAVGFVAATILSAYIKKHGLKCDIETQSEDAPKAEA